MAFFLLPCFPDVRLANLFGDVFRLICVCTIYDVAQHFRFCIRSEDDKSAAIFPMCPVFNAKCGAKNNLRYGLLLRSTGFPFPRRVTIYSIS